MKNSTLAISLLTTMAIFSACTKDELKSAPDGPVALKVNSSILTRAADTNWDANDKIGVTGTSGETDYTNVGFVTAAGDGTFSVINESETIYFQKEDEDVTFTAYYPYDEELNGNVIENVDTWEQANQKTFDFLWAQAKASKALPVATFSFDHKMTKLVLTVKAGDGVSFDEVKNAKLSLGGFNHIGSFNISDGTTQTQNNAAEYVFAGNTTAEYNAPYTENQAESSRTYTLIVFPQGFQSELPFKAVITDMQEFDAELDFTSANQNAGDGTPANSWIKGRQYNISITLNKTSLSIEGCTINAWTEATDDREVEAY